MSVATSSHTDTTNAADALPQKKKKRVSAAQARRNTLRNEAYGLLWYCDYCDVFVSSKQRTKKQHLLGHSHAQNMEAYYNQLKSGVHAHRDELRHKEMLRVFTTDTVEDDWRVELLQDAEVVKRRRLENVLISRRLVVDDDDVGQSSVSTFMSNEGRCEATERSADTSFLVTSSTSLLDNPYGTSGGSGGIAMMRPTPPVIIAPGITVGGVVMAGGGAALQKQSILVGAHGLPAVHIGGSLIAEGHAPPANTAPTAHVTVRVGSAQLTSTST